MSIGKTKMRPLPIAASQKRDVRTQFGALCYRVHKDNVQVLLVTSRGTGRWILPKGWPMGGATPSDAALGRAPRGLPPPLWIFGARELANCRRGLDDFAPLTSRSPRFGRVPPARGTRGTSEPLGGNP